MFKKIAMLLSAFIILFSNVYADADITDFDNELTARISLTDIGTKGISGIIYRPGKADDIYNAFSNQMVDITDFTAGAFQMGESVDGNYSIDIALDNQSGIYNMVIYDIENKQNINLPFFFAGRDDYKNVVDALNAIDDVSAIEEYLTTGRYNSFYNYDILELNGELYDKADKHNLAQLVHTYLGENSFKNDNREENRDKFRYMLLAACAYNKTLTDFEVLADNSHIIKNGDLYEWYNSSLMTDKVKSDILSRINGRKYLSTDEFTDSVIEAFVLEICEHNDGYMYAKDIITKFEDKIKINSESYSDRAYYAVSGNHFESFDELVRALSNNNGSSSSTGGSGGSGSGKVSVPATSVAVDLQNVQKNEALDANLYFDDISSVEWAHEAIQNLKLKNVISGKTERLFYPDDYVTREEFVKMIVTVSKLMQTGDIPDFEDVSENDWYYTYVNIAYSNNIIKGMSDNIFGSGRNITREDIAVILYNASKSGLFKLELKEEKVFADSDKISEYASQAVKLLSSAQIINGFEDGTFRPGEPATRAQAAKMIYESFK